MPTNWPWSTWPSPGLPAEHRAGHRAGDDADDVVHPIVVRTDTAGYVAAFVAALVARNVEFSIGARVNDQVSAAIGAVPAGGWRRAIDGDGEPRHRGEVAELRGVDPRMAAGDPGHLPA